jgi:hypothetical protein
MPKTPDRTPGVSDEEGTIYEATGVAAQAGEVRFTGTRFSMHDGTIEFDPATGSGLSEAQHETLDTLTHSIAEDSHQQITRTSGKTQNVTWYTDSGETVKIREMVLTRDPVTTGKVSVVTLKQYDGTGTLSVTLTGTLNRVSGKVDSIDWVVS